MQTHKEFLQPKWNSEMLARDALQDAGSGTIAIDDLLSEDRLSGSVRSEKEFN